MLISDGKAGGLLRKAIGMLVFYLQVPQKPTTNIWPQREKASHLHQQQLHQTPKKPNKTRSLLNHHQVSRKPLKRPVRFSEPFLVTESPLSSANLRASTLLFATIIPARQPPITVVNPVNPSPQRWSRNPNGSRKTQQHRLICRLIFALKKKVRNHWMKTWHSWLRMRRKISTIWSINQTIWSGTLKSTINHS